MAAELSHAQIQELVALMEARRLTCPKSIARRLNISVRTVYRIWRRNSALSQGVTVCYRPKPR